MCYARPQQLPTVYDSSYFTFSLFVSTLYFFIVLFICIFLAVLGLYCCVGFFLVAVRGGWSLVVCSLLIAVDSPVEEQRL